MRSLSLSCVMKTILGLGDSSPVILAASIRFKRGESNIQNYEVGPQFTSS